MPDAVLPEAGDTSESESSKGNQGIGKASSGRVTGSLSKPKSTGKEDGRRMREQTASANAFDAADGADHGDVSGNCVVSDIGGKEWINF